MDDEVKQQEESRPKQDAGRKPAPWDKEPGEVEEPKILSDEEKDDWGAGQPIERNEQSS
jgi:hypothetical protein